jgi:hypothetical protein
MLHIAISRPARGQDATEMCRLVGIHEQLPPDPMGQLNAMGRYLGTLEQWVAPRVFGASVARLNAARDPLSSSADQSDGC